MPLPFMWSRYFESSVREAMRIVREGESFRKVASVEDRSHTRGQGATEMTVDEALVALHAAVRDKVRIEAEHKGACEKFDISKRQAQQVRLRAYRASVDLEEAVKLEMKRYD